MDSRGALDCTHIILRHAPPLQYDPLSYIDRKGKFSIQVQALVDEDMVFRDVYIGWPGSVHDFRVLWNSSLYARAGELFGDGSYVLADAGYAALPWLIPAYRDVALTPAQMVFNTAHATCRGIVERSFGVLKGRWPILRNLDVAVPDMPTTIAACFLLHNICAIDRVRYAEQERADDQCDVDPEELVRQDAEENVPPEDISSGEELRERMVEYMCTP